MSPASSQRLLEGTGAGGRLNLATHLQVHGELSIPRRKESSGWSAAMISEISSAGLTGRGGGGFPTARKLESVMRTRRRCHLVINVMEGEPAAQKDSVLACFAPHLILDGAEVLAAIIDAAVITVAVARDNPAAASSLAAAIAERKGARGRGAPSIDLQSPPGRYIGGEESGLIHWLDGGLAMPTFRPEKPGKLMIGSRQALVDNAETAATVALIARRGGAWFSGGGTAGTAGTTLVTISGEVQDPGVFEVPLGSPLRDVVANARPTGTITGLLLGGYGGTFVGPDALDAPYSRDGLRPFGSGIGAGIIIVFDTSSCGITETARIARWMANESAGQCGPCIFGLPAVASDLEMLATGRGGAVIERQLHHRLETIAGRGACAHPDGVIRMVRSALSVFETDLATHRDGHRCQGASKATVLALPLNGGELEWR